MKTTLLTVLMMVFAISVYAQQVTRDQVPRVRVIVEEVTDVTG